MNKVKRFLEPIKETPFIYARSFFVFMLWGVGGIIHIILLQYVTGALENNN